MFDASETRVLTLFAIPKAFVGEFAALQRNAIVSWTLLKPATEIILFGDEDGTAKLAHELHLQHVPEVAVNEYGTPLLDDLFAKAQALASGSLLAYVNADIILMDDFTKEVSRVSRRKKPFVLGGRRSNLAVEGVLAFEAGWQDRLRSEVRIRGRLGASTGIDYFVFPKGTWNEVPPFAIGRTMWDNWLLYYARARRYPVIDASETITVVHQLHGYSHLPPQADTAWKGPETHRNWDLARGIQYAFTLDDATHRLTPGGLRRCFGWKDLQQYLMRFPVLHPRRKLMVKAAATLLFLTQRMAPGFKNQSLKG